MQSKYLNISVSVLYLICIYSEHMVKARKNVLFILSDDLRPEIKALYDKASPYQMNPSIYTPNLDEFSKHSVVFRKAYVQVALCSPSRTSFLTGRRPDTTKVYNLKDHFRNVGGNFTTIPQYFKEHGYRSIGMGKIFHHQTKDGGDILSWSHDEPYFTPKRRPSFWETVRTEKSWIAINETTELEHPLHDDRSTDYAIGCLRRLAPKALSGEENFILSVGFALPHLPFIFPRRFLRHYPMDNISMPTNPYLPKNMPPYSINLGWEFMEYADIAALPDNPNSRNKKQYNNKKIHELRRAYFASISYVDSLFGHLIQELKDLGLSENTIVLFAGDHGYHLYEHAIWGKLTDYEIATRAPLMIHVPGITDNHKGFISDHLVEFTDIYPTLVELAGLQTIPQCPENSTNVKVCSEGSSLVPIINNPMVKSKPRVFSQYLRQYRRQYIMGYSMRTRRYRYTEWIEFISKPANTPMWNSVKWREMHDHLNDPEENINLAKKPEYAEIVERLSRRLRNGWRAVRQQSGANIENDITVDEKDINNIKQPNINDDESVTNDENDVLVHTLPMMSREHVILIALAGAFCFFQFIFFRKLFFNYKRKNHHTPLKDDLEKM
ncbi:unnamed protein product [Owenia fusiformis]|uniref:Uncharacterized protein n=1 Tax=Owenia fusiformis TaxID=6347 RepID=A0A8J1TBJ3_OWEFU|nr:unnamed protein product [Owenia fusiformis]